MSKNLKEYFIGLDIGGTKCAIIVGDQDFKILRKVKFETKVERGYAEILDEFHQNIEKLFSEFPQENLERIGISCGGPLDSKAGIIHSPPNLPDWDNVPIVHIFSERYGVPVAIQNDANACALAEWKFGAGQGTRNMIFMTLGTGLGAGLILEGKLYSGTNDNAGEVGHIRLDNFGPVGYGKAGSFEGFCSGSGIAQLAKSKAREKLQMGISTEYCKSINEIENITAKAVAEAAERGDELALEVYKTSGSYLGKGISILVDVLNPELVVIGSIYERSGHLLNPSMIEIIKKEALPLSRKVCKVVPAGLGDMIGDYASLSVAVYGIEDKI